LGLSVFQFNNKSSSQFYEPWALIRLLPKSLPPLEEAKLFFLLLLHRLNWHIVRVRQFVESLKQFLHDTRQFPCCRLRLLMIWMTAVVRWRRHCSLVLSMSGEVRGKANMVNISLKLLL